MKIRTLCVFLTTCFSVVSTAAMAQELYIYSDATDQFLGTVQINGEDCNDYDMNCVWNDFSQYGSEVGVYSIWNDFSQYGSEVGAYSVCNMNISYEDTPALYLVYEDGSDDFYDYIGPDVQTDWGRWLYNNACD